MTFHVTLQRVGGETGGVAGVALALGMTVFAPRGLSGGASRRSGASHSTRCTTYVGEEAGGVGRPITMAHRHGNAFALFEFRGAELFLRDTTAHEGGFPNATEINVMGEFIGGRNDRGVLPPSGWREGRPGRGTGFSRSPSP